MSSFLDESVVGSHIHHTALPPPTPSDTKVSTLFPGLPDRSSRLSCELVRTPRAISLFYRLPAEITRAVALKTVAMHARDAAGRRVSLLNEDAAIPSTQAYLPYSMDATYSAPSYYAQAPRTSSTPTTPQLLRSDSYDSHMSTEPISPITPLYEPIRYVPAVASPYSSYEEYYVDAHMYAGTKRRPSLISDGRSDSYEDDATAAPASGERPAKRFPCRYRDSHGCEKTFTTSGHASRHSKIHTAEKAVPCSFKGCPKKFTRADNMKQHLETHYKDKSRSTSSRPSLSSERRSSASGKSSSRSKAANHSSNMTDSTPLPSPVGGAWDMRQLNLPLLNRPSAVHSPASGLDALAMAVACQEGA